MKFRNRLIGSSFKAAGIFLILQFIFGILLYFLLITLYSLNGKIDSSTVVLFANSLSFYGNLGALIIFGIVSLIAYVKSNLGIKFIVITAYVSTMISILFSIGSFLNLIQKSPVNLILTDLIINPLKLILAGVIGFGIAHLFKKSSKI